MAHRWGLGLALAAGALASCGQKPAAPARVETIAPAAPAASNPAQDAADAAALPADQPNFRE